MEYLIREIKDKELEFLKNIDFSKIPVANLDEVDSFISIYETRTRNLKRLEEVLEGNGNVLEGHRLLTVSEIKKSIKEQKVEVRELEKKIISFCF